MDSWAKRSPLVWPSGIRPGVDFNHPVLSGCVLRHSSVAGIGFGTAASGGGTPVGYHCLYPQFQRASSQGSATQAITSAIDGIVGPYISVPPATNTSANFTGQTTSADASLVMAAIFSTAALPTAVEFVASTGNTGAALSLQLSAAGVFGIGLPFSTVCSSGFTVAANTPYFVAASCRTGAQAYVILNLASGALTTATSATAIAMPTPTGTVAVLTNAGNASSFGGRFAAFMFAEGWLSVGELRLLANDPWSIWYPQPEDNFVGVIPIDVPNFWRGFSFPNQWSANRQLFLNAATDVPAVITSDAPSSFVSRTLLPQWNINQALRKGTAQDLTSPAIETNTHFIPRSFPLQWNINRALEQVTSQDFTSPAVETNTHFIPKAFPPQWNKLALLLRGITEDISQPETNTHWIAKPWPVQWNRTLWQMQNPALDVPVVVAFDTPIYFSPIQWESQWNVDVSLVEGGANDQTSAAIETNPHWRGRPWTPQWNLNAPLARGTAQDFSTVIFETPPHWRPTTWLPQWSSIKWQLQNPALDVPVVSFETNPHWRGTSWLAQWCRSLGLLQNPALDVPAVVVTVEAAVSFVPLQWESQWNVDVSLVEGGANDQTSAAIETNPHWRGQPWIAQWNRNVSLARGTAQDFSTIIVESTPYFIPHQLPLQWNLNRSLARNTAQDFSTIIVEGGAYSNLHSWAPPWAPRWRVQASLMQGTAQDFSTTPPPFVEIYENPFFQSFARVGAIGRNP